jgi:hypothetical protein
VLPKLSVVFAALLTSLLFAAPSVAQEDVTWPPNPDEVFTDAVEVLEATPVLHISGYEVTSIPDCGRPARLYNSQPYPSRISGNEGQSVVFDQRRGVIYVYEGSAVEAYSWSLLKMGNRINVVCRRSDGTIILERALAQKYSYTVYDYLSFKLDTGVLHQPDNVCGAIRALPGEGFWVALQEGSSRTYRFCFTETGELTEPVKLSWDFMFVLATSPNKQSIILARSLCILFYAYNISSRDLIPLYQAPRNAIHGTDCWVERWLNEKQFLLYFDSPQEWSPIPLFEGDITEENSLNVLIPGYHYGAQFYENPPRFEHIPWLTGEGNGWGGDFCELDIFYLGDDRLVNHELGDLCTPNISVPEHNETRLFRVVQRALKAPADLVSYDLQTRQRTHLMTGEIEHIFGTSPDGRYIILLLDDNGLIDLIPDINPIYSTSPSRPQIAIYDTVEGEIVYEFDAEEFPIGAFRLDEIEVNWFASDAFVLTGYDGAGGGPPYGGRRYLRFVWPAEQRHIVLDNVFAYVFSPDHTHLVYISTWPLSVYWTEDTEEMRQAVEVLDLMSGEVTVIQDEVVTGELDVRYNSFLDWNKQNRITVTLVPAATFYPDNAVSFEPAAIRYTLALRDGS